MSAFKPQQRHLTIEGRDFHFVAYEGSPTNLRRGQEPYPAMWCLMVEGRRCPVHPFDATESLLEVDAVLLSWAEDNAVGPTEPATETRTPQPTTPSQRYENWWGPN